MTLPGRPTRNPRRKKVQGNAPEAHPFFKQRGRRPGILFPVVVALLLGGAGRAQEPPRGAAAQPPPELRISLDQAIARARTLSPEFLTAATEAALARQDKMQARATLFPGLFYTNQVITTEGNNLGGPIYIANNGLHEYVSQADVRQNLSLAQLYDYRRTVAAEALQNARLSIANRGLVFTVVQSYFTYAAARNKLENAAEAAREAEWFVNITQKLERGGEVARADVVKAQLQLQDRERQLREARLNLERARLGLALLTMPDVTRPFTLADDMSVTPPLPSRQEIEQGALRANPDLKAAFAAVRVSNAEWSSARAALFPSLTFDYFYGIDAARFATRTAGLNNLGSAAQVTLNIPVWDWGARLSRMKQGRLRAELAQRNLTFAQRKLASDIEVRYGEAETSLKNLQGLDTAVHLAEESLRLTRLRYQAGEATTLEVVDAQNALVSAGNLLADGHARYRVALAGLQLLTGKL